MPMAEGRQALPAGMAPTQQVLDHRRAAHQLLLRWRLLSCRPWQRAADPAEEEVVRAPAALRAGQAGQDELGSVGPLCLVVQEEDRPVQAVRVWAHRTREMPALLVGGLPPLTLQSEQRWLLTRGERHCSCWCLAAQGVPEAAAAVAA